MKKVYFVLLSLATFCCSCTYTISQVQTRGSASDVIDDTTTPTVNTTTNVPINPKL